MVEKNIINVCVCVCVCVCHLFYYLLFYLELVISISNEHLIVGGENYFLELFVRKLKLKLFEPFRYGSRYAEGP